jgi:TolB-like protein
VVNVAARLEGQSPGGGVCVSDDVHRHVAGRVEYGFDDLGRLSVKNIPYPVPAWQVRLDGPDPRTVPATVPSSYERFSVAVLPLANYSRDPEQDYFAEGITGDLTTMLSRFTDLRVTSRSSAAAVSAQGLDGRQVARRLDVAYLVEGSVQRAGGRVRITIELTEAESGHVVWADQFDRDIEDILAVQDEVVAQIASQVLPQVDRHEVDRMRAVGEDRLDTWDLLIRGRHQLYVAPDPARAAGAIRLFEAAVARDPTSARAHAALAGGWIEVAFHRWRIDDRNPFTEQQRAALQAYQLDPDDPVVLSVATAVHTIAGNNDEAEQLAARAIEKAPFDALTVFAVAQERLYRGDLATSITQFTEAWRLGQHERWRFHIAAGLSCAHYLAENYEAAWAWAQKGLEIDNYYHLHALGAAALAQLGRADEAQHRLRYLLAAAPAATAASMTRTIRWEHQSHIQHYREGLIKAGLADH